MGDTYRTRSLLAALSATCSATLRGRDETSAPSMRSAARNAPRAKPRNSASTATGEKIKTLAWGGSFWSKRMGAVATGRCVSRIRFNASPYIGSDPMSNPKSRWFPASGSA